MNQNRKDMVQYGAACVMLLSAVVLAYFSFFLLNTVVGSVLGYVSICVAFAGAVFGISTYVKNEFGVFESKANERLDQLTNKVERLVEDTRKLEELP